MTGGLPRTRDGEVKRTRYLQGCFIGCGVVLVATVIAVVLLVRWWTAPIDIPRVPPPTYPTPNAYEVYKKLAVQMKEKHERTPQLKERERQLEQAFEVQRASHVNLLHDFYEGKEELTPEWFGTGPDAPRHVPPARWLNLRAAAHEQQSLYEMAIRESRKPVVQQAKVPQPKHIMNVVLFPMPDGVLRK